jgi:hypothetical protein
MEKEILKKMVEGLKEGGYIELECFGPTFWSVYVKRFQDRVVVSLSADLFKERFKDVEIEGFINIVIRPRFNDALEWVLCLRRVWDVLKALNFEFYNLKACKVEINFESGNLKADGVEISVS